MTARQAHALAHPIADPASGAARNFRETERVAGGVLISILTVNR